MSISFTCSGCDGQMRVADDMAGRKAKCSRCGTITTIPMPGGSTAAPKDSRLRPKPAPRPPEPDNAFANLDGGAAEKPLQRRKRRSSTLLFGLIGGGLLFSCCACTGIGVGVYFYFFASGLPSEQKYLPDNCEMVAFINMAEVLDSSAYKRLVQEMPDAGKSVTSSDNLGIDQANIATMLVGAESGGIGGGSGTVMVIKTKKAVTAKEIQDRRKAVREKIGIPDRGGPATKEDKVGKYTLHVDALGSFSVVADNLVVTGDFEALRKILQRDSAPTIPSHLKDVMKEASFSKSFALAGTFKDSRTRDTLKQGLPVPGVNPAEFFKEAEGLVVQGNIGSAIDLEVKVLCKDSKSAEELRKMAEGWIITLKKTLEGAGVDQSTARELTTILDGIKMSNSGAKATAQFKLQPDPIIKLARDRSEPKKPGPRGKL
jgi:hypothetical protein